MYTQRKRRARDHARQLAGRPGFEKSGTKEKGRDAVCPPQDHDAFRTHAPQRVGGARDEFLLTAIAQNLRHIAATARDRTTLSAPGRAKGPQARYPKASVRPDSGKGRKPRGSIVRVFQHGVMGRLLFVEADSVGSN